MNHINFLQSYIPALGSIWVIQQGNFKIMFTVDRIQAIYGKTDGVVIALDHDESIALRGVEFDKFMDTIIGDHGYTDGFEYLKEKLVEQEKDE